MFHVIHTSLMDLTHKSMHGQNSVENIQGLEQLYESRRFLIYSTYSLTIVFVYAFNT